MAKKRIRHMNPDEVRVLGKDVDDVLIGSESTIDLLYQEYFQEQRDLITFEDIRDNLQRNDQSIPSELKVNIRNTKERLRELDRRIVRYGNLMLERIRDRLKIVEGSPGASVRRGEIQEVKRGIFRLEKKMRDRGSDIRPDIQRLMTALVNLEQDSGIFLAPPVRVERPESKRKAGERDLYAGLADEWRRVFRHAKNDPRAQEDIEWVNAQLRSLSDQFERGESIRLGMERVARRIRDIHNRTKPRAKLQDFDSASQGIQDFAGRIKEYASGEITPAGIDKLQFELEQFSRQFSPQAKAEWAKEEQRKFGRAIRELRKALDKLRPRRRKNPRKNPCVGLHFHGKDADELLEALEKSSRRMIAPTKTKENPKRRAKKKAAKRLPKNNPEAAGAVIPMKIPIPSGYSKYFTYPADGPDSDGWHTYRWRGRPVSRLRVWRGISGDSFPWNGIIYVRGKEVHNIAADDRDAIFSEAVDALTSLAPAKNQNPKKRASKKKASKKSATPEWKRLISRCQKLWNQYLDRPSKKTLKDVFAHLEKMEKSMSERVKKERARCLRVANQEAKRLGI